MYFVRYSTNRLELPLPGWNIWKIRFYSVGSYKILKIIIGGKKRATATHVSINDKHHLADNERSVIKILFEEEI